MRIQEILKEKRLTIYKLSAMSKVPYATLHDIYSGKAHIEKCSAETVYQIARALDVTMEELIQDCVDKSVDFDMFKSNVCHRLKEMGDIDFILHTLTSGDIPVFFEKKRYPECFYLLGMVDYLSRINNVDICNDFDRIRKCKLKEELYPASIRALKAVDKFHPEIQKAKQQAIPEFKRFNIIECEVRDVV
ncbi:MAG: helix-turn-helix transcriptional regulator [Eubacterium sp.]|nr:helix-turn-helix transcriptional regulator [Eubacterium sp.]